MQTTFEALEANYTDLDSHAVILPGRETEIAAVAEYLIRDKATYLLVEQKTHVPAAVLMALAEREMDGNLHCYLGNGQNLKRRTTIVPLGRGPFMETFPNDFVAGCLDSLALDGLDKVWQDAGGWSIPRFCYESESWNGWGYRARGIPSPYVYGATTVQKPGKFPRDHYFDATLMDPQIGTLAIVEEIVKQDPSLEFADGIPKISDAPSIVPVVLPHPVMGTVDIRYVQISLNKIKVPGTPLLTDGNCGRATRAAVRAFQVKYHLSVDGIPGPQVVEALKQVLAEAGMA